MALQSIATKHVLLLRTGLDYFVCDQYWPHDGRVHILGMQCYGQFIKDSFTLEIRKAALDIEAIIYDKPSWPDAIQNIKDRSEILAHFGRHD